MKHACPDFFLVHFQKVRSSSGFRDSGINFSSAKSAEVGRRSVSRTTVFTRHDSGGKAPSLATVSGKCPTQLPSHDRLASTSQRGSSAAHLNLPDRPDATVNASRFGATVVPSTAASKSLRGHEWISSVIPGRPAFTSLTNRAHDGFTSSAAAKNKGSQNTLRQAYRVSAPRCVQKTCSDATAWDHGDRFDDLPTYTCLEEPRTLQRRLRDRRVFDERPAATSNTLPRFISYPS